jgi:hypothetical protein
MVVLVLRHPFQAHQFSTLAAEAAEVGLVQVHQVRVD